MSHVVHDAGEDGGELLLAGARHDGLLVRAVLGPQRGQQRHEHRQDVGPHLQKHGGNNDSVSYTNHQLFLRTGRNRMNSVSLLAK